MADEENAIDLVRDVARVIGLDYAKERAEDKSVADWRPPRTLEAYLRTLNDVVLQEAASEAFNKAYNEER